MIFFTLKIKLYYITCPTNIFPVTLSDSVGEVPIVTCINQEICRNRTCSQISATQGNHLLQDYNDSHLNDDPLHHSKVIEYWHNTAEKYHYRQSLQKIDRIKPQSFIDHRKEVQLLFLGKVILTDLKRKDAWFYQTAKHKRWASMSVV